MRVGTIFGRGADVKCNVSDFDDKADMTTGKSGTLRGKFLLAGGDLIEPNFARTVILIVRHDADGALGLVVNRPLGVTLDEACGERVPSARGVGVPLFHGGPCEGPVMAVHAVAELATATDAAEEDDDDEEPWSESVGPGVWFTTRTEALVALMGRVRESLAEEAEEAVAGRVGVKFAAGYAGWGSGQLESELLEGSWQVCDAPPADVFAGGGPGFPTPPATTSLPEGAAELLTLLGGLIEGGSDPTPALAAGVRQWVRLSTRANLARMVPERLIPDDPSVN